MRRSVLALKTFGVSFTSPPTTIPDVFMQRVANQKQVTITEGKDPKNKWGLKNVEMLSAHTSIYGDDRWNYGHSGNRGGVHCDVPPIPVYRQQVWCQGTAAGATWSGHPKISIKVPRGKVIACKWCRLKYMNMATDDDNDENWKAKIEAINTKPETEGQLRAPVRQIRGVMPKDSNFQDGKEPHPWVYRTVFDPNVYYKEFEPERVVEKLTDGAAESTDAKSTD
jgi:hypothetical protein